MHLKSFCFAETCLVLPPFPSICCYLKLSSPTGSASTSSLSSPLACPCLTLCTSQYHRLVKKFLVLSMSQGLLALRLLLRFRVFQQVRIVRIQLCTQQISTWSGLLFLYCLQVSSPLLVRLADLKVANSRKSRHSLSQVLLLVAYTRHMLDS